MDNRRPELTKRQKEIARAKKQQEKLQEKIDRRHQRHREREQRLAGGAPEIEEDPDIAGIVPGPQPPLEE